MKRISDDDRGAASKREASKHDSLSAGAIRQRNVAKILKAAEIAFARHGFSGASTAEIAKQAGVPKANLHYYFRTKTDLYSAVLVDIVENWNHAMEEITAESDPAEALSRYIAKKVKASQRVPIKSRLWANEILSGARHVQPVLKGGLRDLLEEKAVVIEGWIADGKIAPVEPRHLFFMLWSMTQTYADFSAQIGPLLGRKLLDNATFRDATEIVTDLVLGGLGLRPVALAKKAPTKSPNLETKSHRPRRRSVSSV